MSEKRIMIVAGEASGDLHGGRLALALKARDPELVIAGLGGSEMAAAGVEILSDVSGLSVMGIMEVLLRLRDIRSAMRILKRRLQTDPPALLILIDFPDFNLRLAAAARKLQVPVMYYISPKVWAWRTGRVKKIRRLVDRMAVILPFEKDFYRRHGLEVDFVGHPLLDIVRVNESRSGFLQKHDIAPESIVVGILPGSRRQEVKTLLPVFLAAAALMTEETANMVFLLPLASTLTMADLVDNGLNDYCPGSIDLRVVKEERYELMAACDAVMAASGTVTLELAILGVPMVVAYRLSRLSYIFGRWLIKVKYASLVNLVAGREVVPELLQNEATPEKIGRALLPLLQDADRSSAMRRQLAGVRRQLGEEGASDRAAQVALEIIAKRKGPEKAGARS